MKNTSREEGHGKIDSFLNKEYIKTAEPYKNIIKTTLNLWWKKEFSASLMDIFNTKWISENELLLIFNNLFSELEEKTNITYFDSEKHCLTEEWVNYINNVLNESIKYYINYMKRSIGKNFIKKWNSNKSEDLIQLQSNKKVIEFFLYSWDKNNSNADRQIHCSLLKIAFGIHDINLHKEEIDNANADFNEIKKEYFFPYFWDQKDKEAYNISGIQDNWNFRYLPLKTKWKKTILFYCSWRVKQKNQILIKGISDPKYDSIQAIKDIYWLRNEVKNPDDGLYLLEYIRVEILGKQGEIEYKNIFWKNKEESERFIRQYASKLDPDFYLHILNAVKKEKKLDKSNKKYKDVKIRGKLKNHKTEIQIALVENKNESWYAHHLIFDCKKKIRALSRLQWYIPESIIYRYIEEIIDENINTSKIDNTRPELINLWWYHWPINKITDQHKQATKKKIFDYLVDQEKDVIKLTIPKANNSLNYYTSRMIWNHFHENKDHIKLYPDWAQAKDITTDRRTDETIN